MKLQLDHVNIYVKSVKDSVNWYTEVFGFKVVEEETTSDGRPVAILRNGNSMICMSEPQSVVETKPGSRYQVNHFSFAIEDRAGWEKRMDQLKIPEKYGGATRYPFSTSWYVEDPTGHEIEVVHWDSGQPQFP